MRTTGCQAVLLLQVLLSLHSRAGCSAAAASEIGPATLRRSLGRGRDTKCIEPPPPLRDRDLSAHRKSGASAPAHVKYLALDGTTDTTTSSWTNLGFIGPSGTDGTVNETELDQYLAKGYDMFLSMQGITVETRADNSRGPGGPMGPLRTPFRTPGRDPLKKRT
jgi:hypothetical protein